LNIEEVIMDNPKKEKTTINLSIGYRAPREQADFLQMMKQKGYTITDIIRRAIDAYIEDYNKKNKK